MPTTHHPAAGQEGFRRSVMRSVSATIDVDCSILLKTFHEGSVGSLAQKIVSDGEAASVRNVALAPLAMPVRQSWIERDIASSDRSSASDRITASVAGDLPRVSRAI
jgi:hypothetical protein